MTAPRRAAPLVRPGAPPAAALAQAQAGKDLCEASYRHKVDVRVPRGGLGRRLDEMMVWCDEHCADGWDTYEHHVDGRTYLRFYFAQDSAAATFAGTWRGLRRG